MTPLHLAFASTNDNDHEVARVLLAAGADPNVDSEGLGTPIVLSAGEDGDEPASAELLLKHGADPELNGSLKGAALMWAVTMGNVRIARLLVESGADVNGSNPKGATVGHVAMESAEMILFLVEQGADFRIANSGGRSACDVGRVQLRQASHSLEQAIREACPNL